MIGRLWRSRTNPADADRYEAPLRDGVVPVIDGAPGCRGVYVLRRDVRDAVEFVLISFYDTITDAVHACAGSANEIALVPPTARSLLTDYDAASAHYEAVVAPM